MDPERVCEILVAYHDDPTMSLESLLEPCTVPVAGLARRLLEGFRVERALPGLLRMGWVDEALVRDLLRRVTRRGTLRTEAGVHPVEWCVDNLQRWICPVYFRKQRSLVKWNHKLDTRNLLRIYAPVATTLSRREWLIHQCTRRGMNGKVVIGEIIRHQNAS